MRVLITCPSCQTSYQVDDDQIKKSDGHARCFQCHHVFNALLNAEPVEESRGDEHLNLPDSADLYDQQPASDQQTDRDLSSLFIQDQNSEIVRGPEDISTSGSNALTPAELLDIDDDASSSDSGIIAPEDLLDIDKDKLAEIEPLTLKPSKPNNQPRPSAVGTFFWTVAILILLGAFLLQVGWMYRGILLANPQARNLIESACQQLPFSCALPAKREPEKYEIIERHVSMHPTVKGILNISLMFRNNAKISQEAPGITLSLFDSNQKLIARRSFSYKDYLKDPPSKAPVFEPGHAQEVSLNLEDPGSDVTGFEFGFY